MQELSEYKGITFSDTARVVSSGKSITKKNLKLKQQHYYCILRSNSNVEFYVQGREEYPATGSKVIINCSVVEKYQRRSIYPLYLLKVVGIKDIDSVNEDTLPLSELVAELQQIKDFSVQDLAPVPTDIIYRREYRKELRNGTNKGLCNR